MLSQKKLQAPVGNFVPPADRPKWQGHEKVSSELLYLGWGKRFLGRNPPPDYRHPGWLYIFLLSGKPVYLAGGESLRPKPGSLIIVHPECPFGAKDKPDGCCTWLLWLWKNRPVTTFGVPDSGYRILDLSRAESVRATQIHEACRMEVHSPDALTERALSAQRLSLEILIARRARREEEDTQDVRLLKMATAWFGANLSARQPVNALCEYLQVSASTLHRLFRKHLGESPAQYHQRLRLNWAREQLLTETKSAKEIAYSLGFSHPGDFSRAYKRHFKETPCGGTASRA